MKRGLAWVSIGATALLGACAMVYSVVCDVSSYGDWPAERKPGSYAFERLPSQQTRAAEAEQLENSARRALQKAGFSAAAAGQEPDVLIQIGARVSYAARSPWDDPIWWRGSFGYWRYRPWIGPSWAWSARLDPPRYEREVGLLIRDRASGKPLFEARAVNEGTGYVDSALLAAMFEAALADFPRPAVNPRRVTVTVTP